MTTASSTQATSVQGFDAPISIRRDDYGIAHVVATTARDAWFGQGFVAAEDRLWQMEYDRRRAVFCKPHLLISGVLNLQFKY